MTARQQFVSVWDAIEANPSDAAGMKARAELMRAIREVVEGWNETQSKSAKRLGVTQPRLNDLLRGRVDKFSLDALMSIADQAGLSVHLHVERPAP